MAELTTLSKNEIQHLLREQGIGAEVMHISQVDIEHPGDFELAVLVKENESFQTVFIRHAGAAVQLKKYEEGTIQRDGGSWDIQRCRKLLERGDALFPYIQEPPFLSRATTNTSQEKEIPLPSISATPEKGTFETIGETLGHVGAYIKHFFLPEANDGDLTLTQKQLLEEMQATKDSRFLDMLMGIASYDVQPGKPMIYRPDVMARVDETLLAILPNLAMEQLVILAAQTKDRLANVTEFWNRRNIQDNPEKVGQDHIDRLSALSHHIQAHIQKLAGEVGREKTISTHYIATHYAHTTRAFVDTPGRMVKGLFDMVGNSNPFNLIPRLLVGGVIFMWDGLTNIPGEIGGLLTAGAYGPFGSELGKEVGDSALLVVPLLKNRGKFAEIAKKGAKLAIDLAAQRKALRLMKEGQTIAQTIVQAEQVEQAALSTWHRLVKMERETIVRHRDGSSTDLSLADRAATAGEIPFSTGQAFYDAVATAWQALQKATGAVRNVRRTALESARAAYQQAYDIAAEQGLHQTAAEAALAKGRALSKLDRRAEAIQAFDNALEHAELGNTPFVQLESLLAKGYALEGNHESETALAVLDLAYERARAINAKAYMAEALERKSFLLQVMEGDPETIREAAEQALDLYDELGHHEEAAVVAGMLGYALAKLGRFEEAACAYLRAADHTLLISREEYTGEKLALTEMYKTAEAQALLKAGRPKDAAEAFHQAEQAALAQGNYAAAADAAGSQENALAKAATTLHEWKDVVDVVDRALRHVHQAYERSGEKGWYELRTTALEEKKLIAEVQLAQSMIDAAKTFDDVAEPLHMLEAVERTTTLRSTRFAAALLRGAVYDKFGECAKAVEIFEKTYVESWSEGDVKNTALALRQFAFALDNLLKVQPEWPIPESSISNLNRVADFLYKHGYVEDAIVAKFMEATFDGKEGRYAAVLEKIGQARAWINLLENGKAWSLSFLAGMLETKAKQCQSNLTNPHLN